MNDNPKELKEYSAQIFEFGCMERPVYLKEDVDAVIADIQKTNVILSDNAVNLNRELDELKKRSSCTFSDDCLRVRHLKRENEQLKAKLESVQASMYCDVVDAGMENRRLKRALWIARAKNAINSYLKWNLFANFESEDKLFTIDEFDETPGATDGQVVRTYTEWLRIWQDVEAKCRAKAKEYR